MKHFYCNKCLSPVDIYCRPHPEGAVLRYVCHRCGPIHSRTGLPYTPVKPQERKISAKKHNGGSNVAKN